MTSYMFGEMVLTVSLVFKSKILQRQNSPSEFQTPNLTKNVLYPSSQEMPTVLPLQALEMSTAGDKEFPSPI